MIGEDPYPSRRGGEAVVKPRRDPVLHGKTGDRTPGLLGAEALSHYEECGLLRLEGLLGQDESNRLAAEAEDLLHTRRDDASPKVVREPGGDEIRSIFEVHEDSAVVRDLVKASKLSEVVRQILGGPIYVHQSRINYKPAFHGQPFHWHSDFETWHVEDGMPRMRALSASIGLTPNRNDNGPLLLIPGSHRYYVSCPGVTPEAHWERSLRRQEAGIPPEPIVRALAEGGAIESATGPPGSVTLFDCNVMHGSNGNITPFPRTNLFLVFNRVDNALGPPYSGQPPRPQHVANRRPEPLP